MKKAKQGFSFFSYPPLLSSYHQNFINNHTYMVMICMECVHQGRREQRIAKCNFRCTLNYSFVQNAKYKVKSDAQCEKKWVVECTVHSTTHLCKVQNTKWKVTHTQLLISFQASFYKQVQSMTEFSVSLVVSKQFDETAQSLHWIKFVASPATVHWFSTGPAFSSHLTYMCMYCIVHCTRLLGS